MIKRISRLIRVYAPIIARPTYRWGGICIFTFVCSLLLSVEAQDKQNPSLAKSSDLSSALSATDWLKVESSIDRGLEWLAGQQQEDGRFPSDDVAQPAVTSLAVMAFLSRGHVPDHGLYGMKMAKAIDFVLSTQRRDGIFSLMPVEPPPAHLTPAHTAIYNHSIAGLMLGEVYGMTSGTRSGRIESAINRALIFHREVQVRKKQVPTDIGGWRYGYPESPDASSDMSVTGWALMFLRSARNAEFNVPKQYFDEGLDFVERCYEKNPKNHVPGVFRYRPPTPDGAGPPQTTLANTASAMLTLILGGRQDHESVTTGVKWFTSRKYPRAWETSYYYLSTYYSSQAMAQVGGDAWNQIFPQITRSLLGEQAKDGSWPADVTTERKFGSSYTTSLAVLALTPPYQILPIYQR